jgi:hypothetical protein
MLGRRREQILIIGTLIGLNILLGWRLGLLWKDYRSSIRWLSAGPAAQRGPTVAPGSNQARQPQSFVDIVDRNVFSPLRGTPPPQPPEEAKAPKLPLLFGTMNLGNGRFALMSPADQSPPLSKRVLPGEEIGGYKLVAIGTSNVQLEWQEKKITLEITPPASRSSGIADRAAAARPTSGAPAGSAPGAMTTVGPNSASAIAARMAPPGAPPDAPVGTVVGGKKKVLLPTPFGTLEQWQDVGPSGSPGPQQAGPPK